jgi:hypothetical protein
MVPTLKNVVESLPFKFIKGDSEVLKRLMLKNDDEFLGFRGKDQFDKKVKATFPNINFMDLYLDWLFISRKSQSIIRFCKDYKSHGEQILKFKYQESRDDHANVIGTEYKALDGIIRSTKDDFWNKYLPPNFPTDQCTIISTYKEKITPIPENLPSCTFEYNLQLFLSNITPTKYDFPKQSFKDSEKMFSDWGIDILELAKDAIKNECSIDVNKDQLRQMFEDLDKKEE